jgi:hypothetical protein
VRRRSGRRCERLRRSAAHEGEGGNCEGNADSEKGSGGLESRSLGSFKCDKFPEGKERKTGLLKQKSTFVELTEVYVC